MLKIWIASIQIHCELVTTNWQMIGNQRFKEFGDTRINLNDEASSLVIHHSNKFVQSVNEQLCSDG